MRFVVPVVLLLVAALHLLPLAGVLGAVRLAGLYGVVVEDPNLEILLRHRAVLFGLLAAFLGHAACHRHLHTLALVAGVVSVGAFLVLAWTVGHYNAALSTVVRADVVALVLLVVATGVHLRSAAVPPPAAEVGEGSSTAGAHTSP